jgi:hypothetical protein
MLKQCGLEVDECYTATWRESKYTLIHSNKTFRLRRTALDKIMHQLLAKFQVVETEIFGFDAVSCNSQAEGKLEDHPGFRIIVEMANKEPVDLEWWMLCEAQESSQERDLLNYRNGLLWKHIERTNPECMTKVQLIKRVLKWGPIIKEHANCVRHAEVKPMPSTHAILAKYQVYKPSRDVMKKVGKVSKQLNKVPSDDGSGEIYVAVNPLMPHLYKMGFTFKDAETRVKALQTAGVLEPFELIRHAKVSDARCVLSA